MSRNNRRPRRGPAGPNVLIEGDPGSVTGVSRDPQGGALDGASVSGNLDAREFGVPQADIDGGVRHLVNPETKPAKTIDKPPRPADYHKEHGVEPDDWGDYVLPPDESEHRPAERPRPEPVWNDAVPVYIAQAPGKADRIRFLVTEGPVAVPTGTTDPLRIAVRDPHRVKFWICNETTPSAAGATSPGVRIGDWETTADNRGLLIPAGQIKDFLGQDDIYLTNQSGSSVTVSFGYETEVEVAGNQP